MKYVKPATAVAAALSMASTPIHAGNLAEPVMEPEGAAAEPVMEAETVAAGAASSGGFVLPLLFLAIIAAAVSSSGDGIPEE